MVRAQGVGGCASEEGIIMGCRHIGNRQETAVDSTLVVRVLRVPGEEVRQELRESDWGWETRAGAGVLFGLPRAFLVGPGLT